MVDDLVGRLLDRYGRTFAEELDIDIERNTPGPLFELLVAAILMSARISHGLAIGATAALFGRGLTTAEKMAASTWQERVDALDEGGYVRFDEQTSSWLGETSQYLLERYGGDLRNLREDAGQDPARERELLKQLKGIGDVGVDIFFREVQVAWEELFPFADDVVLEAADRLGLGSSLEDLRGLVGEGDFPRLVSALVRIDLDGAYEEIREGRAGEAEGAEPDVEQATKADLYEEARRRDISGRSKMTKDELAEALRKEP